MNSVSVFRSDIWWVPFLRTAKSSSDFNRFRIGDNVDEYVRALWVQVVLVEKGQFFFAFDKITGKVRAATAVTMRGNVLYVHFYWSMSYHPKDEALIKDIFDEVCNRYRLSRIGFVQLPVPIEAIGKWDRLAGRIYDEHSRRIVWYKFAIDHFRQFTEYVASDKVTQFVA